MLHAPDPDVSTSHTWWGLTYDQERARLMWMAPPNPGEWDAGGYEGPPLRIYDTQAQDGWGLIMTDPPFFRVSLGATPEYVPDRDVVVFYSNNWNGAGMQQYDPVANAWTRLLTVDEIYYGNPDAPPREAIITYNSANDVLVGFLEREVFVYDFDANAWTRVLEDAGDEEFSARDNRSGSDYDPFSDLHYFFTGGRLFAYDLGANTMTDLEVEGVPEGGMAYFDRDFGVLVMYDNTSSHVVYRHAPAPDPGDDESGSSEGGDTSTTGPSLPPDPTAATTTGAPPDETSTSGSDTGTASPPAEDPASDTGGCSCRHTTTPAPSLLWLTAFALFRRRRRTT
jgi:MYXO-CTERM domain-containing protein